MLVYFKTEKQELFRMDVEDEECPVEALRIAKEVADEDDFRPSGPILALITGTKK